MSDPLRILQENIAYQLDEIRKLFKGNPLITIVVRNPDIPGDADVVLTDDDLDAAINSIQRLQTSAANHLPADTPAADPERKDA